MSSKAIQVGEIEVSNDAPMTCLGASMFLNLEIWLCALPRPM